MASATIIIVSLTMLVLLSGKIRSDLAAVSAAVILGISGVLTAKEVFSGFSRSEVITIMAVFILADDLPALSAETLSQVGTIYERLIKAQVHHY